MRIYSLALQPRHYSYAATASGGRTLPAFSFSPELDLSVVFHPLVQKDLKERKIQIRLSDKDREFISRLLKQADEPLKQAPKKEPPKPKPAAVKPPVKKPDGKAVIPVKQDMAPDKYPPPVRVESLDSDELDLSKLDMINKQNSRGAPVTVKSKSKLHEIQTFMGGRI